jgi:hypothetical protein
MGNSANSTNYLEYAADKTSAEKEAEEQEHRRKEKNKLKEAESNGKVFLPIYSNPTEEGLNMPSPAVIAKAERYLGSRISIDLTAKNPQISAG